MRNAVVSDTWRTVEHSSVTAGCMWRSPVTLAIRSMDIEPTAVCLANGPGSLPCVLVSDLSLIHVFQVTRLSLSISQ